MAAPKLSNDPAAFKHFERRGLASDSFLSVLSDDWATAALFVLFIAVGIVGWMAAYWLG
jgi:hypothetical protein